MVKFGCAAKAPDFRWVTPKGTQDAPRDLILRWLGVLAPRNARCPRGHQRHCGVVRSQEFICKYVPKNYKEHQEVGEIGGSFSGTVKPIVSLPMVICCGRLVVVSSIPPGDFFFVFSAKLLFFGADRRAARDFGPPEKATEGELPIGL